ncbi:MAG: 30S ribosomal protein S6 [Alphaproteobacteria bacterium]|nr:MAG: 30S ribosomal protein S6 [Alphaproteobacteria bacterium]
MAYYESIFIVRQDVPATQVETLSATLAEVVRGLGGTVTKTEQWGLRSLAYRIKKNRKGHYVMMNLDAPWAAVEELSRQIKVNEDILRHLVVRVDALEEGPSAMLVSRNERSPRRYDDSDGPVAAAF